MKSNNYMTRKGYLTENKKVLYSLLLGQCTEGMKGRICGADTWEVIKRGYDAIGLIGALRKAMYNYGDKKDAAHSIHLAHRDWFLLHQREGESNSSYHDRFMSLTDMLEHHAGIFGLHSKLIDQELSGGQKPQHARMQTSYNARCEQPGRDTSRAHSSYRPRIEH